MGEGKAFSGDTSVGAAVAAPAPHLPGETEGQHWPRAPESQMARGLRLVKLF